MELPKGKEAIGVSPAQMASEVYDEMVVVHDAFETLAQSDRRHAAAFGPLLASLRTLVIAARKEDPSLDLRREDVTAKVMTVRNRVLEKYRISDPEEIKEALATYARQMMGNSAN